MDMTLKQFVKQSLLDITMAVDEARKESPVNIAPGRVEGKLQIKPQKIDFNLIVGVTHSNKGAKKASASISIVSVLKAGINDDSSVDEKLVRNNRISFSVPVYFQAPKLQG